MSRKLIFTILAVLGAIGTVISAEFGLHAQLGAAVFAITGILVYIYNEAKADLDALAAQKSKWTDPKFIMTILTAIIGALGSAGVVLPISPELLITILTAIVGFLFKAKPSARFSR